MIHLLGKIYISNDKHIDQFSPKKIIISSDIGGLDSYTSYEEFTNSKILFSFKNSSSLIGSNGVFENHFKFFKYLFEEYQKDQTQIILHLDNITSYEFLLNWFNILLENNSFSNLLELTDFYILYSRLYNTGSSHDKFLSSTAASLISYEKLSQDNISFLQRSITSITREESLNFINLVKEDLSLELLLNSYLYDKSYKQELKNKTSVFYKKTVDSFMYDLRDVFMLNCLDSNYMKTIGISKSYDLTNIYEIFNDESELCKLLFKSKVWNSNFFRGESSDPNRGMFNSANFSSKESEELIRIVDIFRNSNPSKTSNTFAFARKVFEMYDMVSPDFSDETLEQLINEETNQNHEGLVYSATIGYSANLMFIKLALTKYKLSDFDYLGKFRLKK
jgi:hypothetical protein